MQRLERLEEFKREAGGALFTKQQAVSVTLRLLELARKDATDERDQRVLADAMRRISFQYLDSTSTETDEMLDSLGVARLSADRIVEAIEYAIFESEA